MNIKKSIGIKARRRAASKTGALLKMLSNSHRLLILCELADGEKSVGQLARLLGVQSSTASQHLALLRRDRIIARKRDGQIIRYRIASKPALDMVQILHASCCAPSKPRRAKREVAALQP